MRNLQTLLPILVLANLFVEIIESVSIHPVLAGPDMAYLGSKVAFHCFAPNSPLPITYELLRDSSVLMVSGHQGDQPASFFLKVTETSEGSYHCKAKAVGSTGVSNNIKLTVVTPASNTRVTSEPFPPTVYEGSRIVLSCDVTTGSHLSYTWLFNRKEVTSSISPLFNITGNKLVVEKVTPEHAGQYYCTASSRVQDIRRFSSSTEVQVMVKVYISKPKISFSIYKEGDSYHANVTCWSSRGSPPVNFSLLVDDKEVGSFTVTEFPAAWFPITMVIGLNMGVAQCRVTTEMQELMSDPVTLEVVPVGGDVKLEVEYLYRADFKLAAARLSCQVSRGTLPYVSWLFNNSVLLSETQVDSHIIHIYSQPVLPHYVLTDHGQTLFLTTLGPSGYYCCRVRDSYDQSGPWVESAAVLVQATGRTLNFMPQATSPPETPQKVSMTTIELIIIVFCCFLLLMLAVGVACVYKMFDHKQADAHIAVTDSDALPVPTSMSQLGGIQADTFSTHCDDQNQTVEITL